MKILLSALFISVLSFSGASAAEDPAVAESPLDRVVAVVDDDPILASDIDQVIGLGLVEAAAAEDPRELRRRVLDMLIEQRLRFHEIDLYGFAEVPVEEVERQLAGLRRGFDGDAAFLAHLGRLGLDEQGLRQLLARQIMVLIYVEERLGARVFVGLEEVRRHYEEELKPQLVRRGQTVPPIDQVRERIRGLLKEQRLNEEIETWTEELRRDADVVDYFDNQHGELPPVVSVSEVEGGREP